MSNADLSRTIDAAWEDRANVTPSTTGAVREAVEESWPVLCELGLARSPAPEAELVVCNDAREADQDDEGGPEALRNAPEAERGDRDDLAPHRLSPSARPARRRS